MLSHSDLPVSNQGPQRFVLFTALRRSENSKCRMKSAFGNIAAGRMMLETLEAEILSVLRGSKTRMMRRIGSRRSLCVKDSDPRSLPGLCSSLPSSCPINSRFALPGVDVEDWPETLYGSGMAKERNVVKETVVIQESFSPAEGRAVRPRGPNASRFLLVLLADFWEPRPHREKATG